MKSGRRGGLETREKFEGGMSKLFRALKTLAEEPRSFVCQVYCINFTYPNTKLNNFVL